MSDEVGVLKRLLQNLALLAAGCLVAVLLVETVVRICLPQEDIAEWFVAHDLYGVTLKRNFHQRYDYVGHDFTMHVQTNSLGFRDKEHDFSREREEKTILLLGNSFVFGYGINIPDRFDTRLESLLREHGQPMHIVNAGVPSWGTRNETDYARRHFSVIKPDVIVLLFCGNDPGDDRGLRRPALSGKNSILYLPKRFLRMHTHTYRFLLKQMTIARHRQRVSKSLSRNAQAQLDVQSGSAISASDWETTRTLIRGFYSDFKHFNKSGRLIVMAAAPDNEDVQKNLAMLANGKDLVYLDLSEAIADIPDEDRRTPWDGHWSPAMHAVAAKEIHSLLMKMDLLE